MRKIFLLLPLLLATSRAYVIPDVPVVTQSGHHAKFYSDLVKNNVVVMNFVFTTCTTICPTMGATFARVQTLLGPRNVTLISVSIDPSNDTPERLAAWSRKFGARPGWTLVTGEKSDIDQILKAVGVYTADRFSHSPIVIVGDAARGRWERVDGLAAPSAIIATIDRVKGN